MAAQPQNMTFSQFFRCKALKMTGMQKRHESLLCVTPPKG